MKAIFALVIAPIAGATGLVMGGGWLLVAAGVIFCCAAAL